MKILSESINAFLNEIHSKDAGKDIVDSFELTKRIKEFSDFFIS